MNIQLLESSSSSPVASLLVSPRDSHLNLRNQLLVAVPGLEDGMFAGSVVYICEHTAEGAMGLMINQPSHLDVDDMFEQMKFTMDPSRLHYPLLRGGFMQRERGFVLHTNSSERRWQHTVALSDGISLTTSGDILEDMASARGPSNALVMLGFMGWDAGQLEREIADNFWLTAPATPQVLFDVPFDLRAQAAVSPLGIDLHLLVPYAGHA